MYLSSDGTILAVGGPNFLGAGPGVVRIYKYENNSVNKYFELVI